jgi:hypothetical protein
LNIEVQAVRISGGVTGTRAATEQALEKLHVLSAPAHYVLLTKRYPTPREVRM